MIIRRGSILRAPRAMIIRRGSILRVNRGTVTSDPQFAPDGRFVEQPERIPAGPEAAGR